MAVFIGGVEQGGGAGAGDEDGTWTIGVADDDLDGSGEGQTYGVQMGRYAKRGRIVHFTCRVDITSLGTLTTTARTQLVGLPFACATVTNLVQAVVGAGFLLALSAAGQNIVGSIESGFSHINCQNWDSTAGVSNFALSELSADGSLRLSGSYEV